MTLEEDEQYILDEDDFDVTELGDVFEELCSQDLEEHIHRSFAEEVKRHTFTIPEMSNVEITNIVNSLDEIKSIISKRVTKI